MNAIAAIRTHRWGEAEQRTLGQLRASFEENVAVVFHNRPKDLDLPVPVVDIDDDWAAQTGLRTTQDWGWRCGDYSHYALRAARPDFDFYWLIEPDVHFTGSASGFFKAFEDVETDVLGLDPAPMLSASHRFAGSVSEHEPWRAIFALTRVSGRALDYLVEKRRENSRLKFKERRYANDEFFVFTLSQAAEGLSVGSFRDHAPKWFEGSQFNTAPDLLRDALDANPNLGGKAFHPVLGKADFKTELVKRISQVNYLRRSWNALDYLDEEGLEEIVERSSERLLTNLHRVREANLLADNSEKRKAAG